MQHTAFSLNVNNVNQHFMNTDIILMFFFFFLPFVTGPSP